MRLLPRGQDLPDTFADGRARSSSRTGVREGFVQRFSDVALSTTHATSTTS